MSDERVTLTDDEHRALDLTAELWKALCNVAGQGATRGADLGEAAAHIHALQHMVMAQAAGRSYPERYRLMGEAL
jgi:hypothetical protein